MRENESKLKAMRAMRALTSERFNRLFLIIHQTLTLENICVAIPYLVLVTDTALVAKNLLSFQKNLLEII